MLPAILAAVGVGSSLLGDAYNQSQARKAKADAVAAYKKLLIPESETTRRADVYGDDFYTRTMGELNAGAFAYAGALNPETLRTAAFSKMTVGRSATEVAVREQDFGFNKQIQTKIAEVEAQPLPGIDFLNAAESGLGGYLAGENLNLAKDYASTSKKYTEALMTDINNRNYGLGTTKSNTFNPSVQAQINTYEPPQLDITGKLKKKKNNFLWAEPGYLPGGRY